ncbi:unnamed protein product [Cylicostephanus goldi]|uniref:Uncharacterized protein n=1 Tax=Cylicostephanus goldi TaxID=71465 RepID=A0A3P6RG91_CYLGO|nr:unnamed protein product [Cylicostephanus goldi]
MLSAFADTLSSWTAPNENSFSMHLFIFIKELSIISLNLALKCPFLQSFDVQKTLFNRYFAAYLRWCIDLTMLGASSSEDDDDEFVNEEPEVSNFDIYAFSLIYFSF